MDEGESGSHTFTEAGTFSYICTPHPNMKGTVIVRPRAAARTTRAATAPAGAGTEAEADDGPALPNTGMDARGLALLGLMLALGASVRRTGCGARAPAGRIGW